MDKKAKLKRIKQVINKFSKKNDGADVTVGSSDFGKMECVNSGVWAFDYLTKGLPRGKYTHIAGPSGVGKSTFVLRLISYLQKEGLVCALANNERRFERTWAESNGVNMSELIGGNFQDLEQCLDLMVSMAESQACDCIAVDTITALASRGELQDKKGERSTADSTMALLPRRLSQFFRMATARIDDSGMIVILVNQIRKDLGSFIVRDISVGGNALQHAKSLDIFLRKTAKAKWPKDGHLIKSTLLKSSKLSAREGDEAEISFFKGSGFDNAYDISSYALKKNIIVEKSRGQYEYTDVDNKKHNISGKKEAIVFNIKKYLNDNKLLDEVKSKIENTEINNIGEVKKIKFEVEEESEK